jgi:predicted ATP-binding protein involved in virulence
MPLVRLEAEGVGPFAHLEIDFSDGKGKPHLGPHILAGVNGSGKSTVLRAIAWTLAGESGLFGFPVEEWRHSVHGYSSSRASSAIVAGTRSETFVAYAHLAGRAGALADLNAPWRTINPNEILAAAYAPSRAVRYIVPAVARDSFMVESSLAFEGTIHNEALQSALVSLFSRYAISKTKGEATTTELSALLGRLERALEMIFGMRAKLDVDTTHDLVPLLQFSGQALNFSQLPDGARSILGLVTDFLLRLRANKPSLLMIDELDAHLHPQWQRTVLPALRDAFPETQIIVTSHSPFVISSCPGARAHILEIGQAGKARLARSMDAPFGSSILSTIAGIFGVESRFDIRTERELKEWDDLKKAEAIGKIGVAEQARLKFLTRSLSARSEELEAIVGLPDRIPAKTLTELPGPGRKRKRK